MYRHVLGILAAAILACGQAAAQTTFSVSVTMDANGTSDFYLVDYSPASANVGTTTTAGNPPFNPTLTLTIGERYRFTGPGVFNHPLLFFNGPSTLLLSQDGTTNTATESDSGVNWYDDGNTIVYFTLTPALASAWSSARRYECGFHSNMSGTININFPASVVDWSVYESPPAQDGVPGGGVTDADIRGIRAIMDGKASPKVCPKSKGEACTCGY